jgi:methylated-DNA-[protein]-cysteine S-methyltransferase
MANYSHIISSPLGNLAITIINNKLSKLQFLSHTTHLIPKVHEQLNHYFNHSTHRFTLEIEPQGTPFQLSVWQALCLIPTGQTLTYGELATKLHSSPRAIGQACRTNPIPIIIPCHRVIAATHLGGFAGQCQGRMMDIKKWLLTHENPLL